MKGYHSGFIVDVLIDTDRIQIQDTGRNIFFVDRKDQEAMASFKLWFQTSFLKGVSQTVTLFEYSLKSEDYQSTKYITKFITQTV